MLQPTLESTARAQAGGLRQAGPPPEAEGMWQEPRGKEDPARGTTHPAKGRRDVAGGMRQGGPRLWHKASS